MTPIYAELFGFIWNEVAKTKQHHLTEPALKGGLLERLA